METNLSNIRKHLYLTSAKAVSVVPWGEVMDVCRENTDVRWVGFHRLLHIFEFYVLKNLTYSGAFHFNPFNLSEISYRFNFYGLLWRKLNFIQLGLHEADMFKSSSILIIRRWSRIFINNMDGWRPELIKGI